MMVSQYRVVSVSAKGEKLKVLGMLARVASRCGLKDVTSTSTVKDTLILYSQPDVEHFRVDLGARAIGDSVVIDLVGGFGPRTRSFTEAQRILREELEHEFPGHFAIPSPPIPIQKPNQSPEPTAMSVTPRADARVAPATTVAHL